MASQAAPQWGEVEIAFAGPNAANPYTDVDAWAIFTHTSGQQLRRPVFWDGETRTASGSPPRSPMANGSGVFTPRVLGITSNQLGAR